MFVVVQSDKNVNKADPNVTYDPLTHLTKRPNYGPDGTIKCFNERYFHTPETIRQHVEKAGFTVGDVSEYDEQLYRNYERTDDALAPHKRHLIEIVATR